MALFNQYLVQNNLKINMPRQPCDTYIISKEYFVVARFISDILNASYMLAVLYVLVITSFR